MYYISHIGTLPEWKGAGVGAALLRHLNDKLDGHKSSLLAVSEQLVSIASVHILGVTPAKSLSGRRL